MTSTNSHYLDRLLKPQTIALVGVSPREGTVGHDMLKVLLSGGYQGQVFLVNPRYDEIEGHKCYASLSDIPGQVDMAVLSVASHRMEPLFDEAIELNIGGVTIFDYFNLEEGASPSSNLVPFTVMFSVTG